MLAFIKKGLKRQHPSLTETELALIKNIKYPLKLGELAQYKKISNHEEIVVANKEK